MINGTRQPLWKTLQRKRLSLQTSNSGMWNVIKIFGIFAICSLVLYSVFTPSMPSLKPNTSLSMTSTAADSYDSHFISGQEKADTKKYHVIFSTDCSLYSKWQSAVIVHSHRTLGFPGRITRIVSCDDKNWKIPESDYDKYNVVWTPLYDPFISGDRYPPRNRPHALRYLFSTQPDFVDDDEIILLMDPDQILLSTWTDFNVTKGNPIAAGYSSGIEFLKWASPFCGKYCDNLQDKWQLQVGAPYILHVDDLRTIVPEWVDIMEAMREKDPTAGDWQTDMYAYSIATIRLGLRHKRFQMMVSSPTDGGEPWHLTDDPITPPVFVLHYCQKISFGDYSWTKHDYHSLDYADCSKSLSDIQFPYATQSDAIAVGTTLDSLPAYINEMPRYMSHPLVKKNNISPEQVRAHRSAWIYVKLIDFANQAFEDYHNKFCSK